MGTHARWLRSFHWHFCLHDLSWSPFSENEPGDVREIVQDPPSRRGSLSLIGIISEDFPWADMSLQRQESTPCHPSVRASSRCLGGGLIPGIMMQVEGFKPTHCAGRHLALLSSPCQDRMSTFEHITGQSPMNSVFFIG